MSAEYSVWQINELVENLMFCCRCIGYATSGNERANHIATANTAKEKLMSAFTPPPAQAAQVSNSLNAALNALEDAAVNGLQLHGDDIHRFRALVDRIAPYPHSPDAADSGRVDGIEDLLADWRRAADAHDEIGFGAAADVGRTCADDLEAALAAQLEQITDGKAQWDEVANILGADGDNVDDVIAKATALAAQGQGGDPFGWVNFIGELSQTQKNSDDTPVYLHPPASPAGVPDGEDDAAIDRAAHVLQEVIAENDGEPSEMAHDQVRRILAAYAAPSAPEGDGGGE